MANDLDREIRVEQDRSGIHDPAHYAYPTYAKARWRRDNLKHSADELRASWRTRRVQEACDERRKVELLSERERAAQDTRSQADLTRSASCGAGGARLIPLTCGRAERRRRIGRRPVQERQRHIGADPRADGGKQHIEPVVGVADHGEGRADTRCCSRLPPAGPARHDGRRTPRRRHPSAVASTTPAATNGSI